MAGLGVRVIVRIPNRCSAPLTLVCSPTTMSQRRHLAYAVSSLAVALLLACGGEKTTEPIPQVQPPVGIRLLVPDTVTRGQPFSVTVTALDAQGQTHTTWSGTVSLSASSGSITPASVSVTSGVANVQVTLTQHAGQVTITSSVGSVSGSRPALVLSGEPAASLRISPASFLLAGASATQPLRVEVLDAGGRPTTAPVSWESSNAGVVTVSSSGLATASASGSAQVIARSGSIASPPVVALVATPATGAVLVADEQIVGAYTAVDTAAPYGPGWRYRVRLQGLAPQVGQTLIARGEKPLGGKVISVQGSGSAVDVTMEVVPLRELLPDLSINETIPLQFETPSGASVAVRPAWAALYENEFTRGPFECSVKLTQPNSNPFTMTSVTTDVTPTFYADIIQTPTRNRFVVHGGLTGSMTVKPTLTAALDGSLECKAQVGEIPIPMPGVIAFFFAATVPVGLGFEVNGGITLATMSVDLVVSAASTITMGWDCNPSCVPVLTATGTATGSVKPDFPSPGSDLRFTAAVSPFAWAELEVGPPDYFPGSANARFKPLETKAGVKLDFNVTSADVQANDATYASSYSLAPFFSGGTTEDLQHILTLFSITIPPLTYSASGAPLATSPTGSFRIVPSRVNGASPTAPGDTATFIVDLTNTSDFQYAVDSVKLFRKPSGSAALVPAPGSCASIAPTTAGQSLFTCKTDLPVSMAGEQTFYAFVKPILITALPVLLEVSPDAKGTLTVDHTVYFRDFTTGLAGAEWTSSPLTTSPSGQRFLGTLGNTSTTLNLTSLPAHTQLVLEFDLYIIDSWNGNGGGGGTADIIEISVVGGPVLKRTTFSNRTRDAQAYPGDYPGGVYAAGTGRTTDDTLGYPASSDGYGDSSYRLRLVFNHTGGTIALKFASQQSSGQNEKWGIDNVRVTIVP